MIHICSVATRTPCHGARIGATQNFKFVTNWNANYERCVERSNAKFDCHISRITFQLYFRHFEVDS